MTREAVLRLPSAPRAPAPRYLAQVLLLALASFAVGKLVVAFGSSGEQLRLLWVPSGIGVAALFLGGLRLWPGVVLGPLALGWAEGYGAAQSAGLAAGSAVEALLGAWLLARGVRLDPRCERLHDVLGLALAAVAAGGAGSLLEISGAPAPGTWNAWWMCWLARALGIFLVAPVMLAWLAQPRLRLPPARLGELAAVGVLTLLVSVVVFGSMADARMVNPLPYALFPVMLWGALRLGQREVSVLVLIAAAVAVWGTARGSGPFMMPTPGESLASLYLFLAVVAVAALALTAVMRERAAAEEATRERARQYSTLVETMNEGLVVQDGGGTVTFANGSFARLLGYGREEIVRMRFEDLVAPASLVPWREQQSTRMEGGDAPYEIDLRRRDGSVVPVSVSPRPVPGPQGETGGSFAVVADISEWRRRDELLQWIARATAPHTGEDFFRSLMKSLAGVFHLKYAFITECADRPVTRLRTLAFWDGHDFRPNFEYALAGTPCEATVREGVVSCYPEGVSRLFPRERELGVEGYLGVPIWNSTGTEVIGHVAFLSEGAMGREVLDSPLFQIFTSRAGAELRRKRAEDQARGHLQQLARVSRVSALGEMASAIAHEINQPLAAIMSYTQACRRILERGDADRGEIGRAMERVAAQADRAGEIIRRLRGLMSRDESELKAVDVNYLVREVAELIRAEARQGGVQLSLELDASLPPVQADGIQIQQVILNLLRNGIEAVSGLGGPEQAVTVTTAPAAGRVRVTVRDTGHGLDPDAAEKVFEAFYTTKVSGMGIGLAISRSIAEAHGGRLWAESGPGGAVFHLELPGAPEGDAK